MATDDNILPAPYLLKLLYTLYDITIPKVILLCYLLQCCANMAEFSSTSQCSASTLNHSIVILPLACTVKLVLFGTFTDF